MKSGMDGRDAEPPRIASGLRGRSDTIGCAARTSLALVIANEDLFSHRRDLPFDQRVEGPQQRLEPLRSLQHIQRGNVASSGLRCSSLRAFRQVPSGTTSSKGPSSVA